MKLFKDSDNNIHAYELDGSQDHLIDGKIPITEDEADVIRQSMQQTQFDAMSYAEKRRGEYPPATDYLDGIVKGDAAQVQVYINTCLAIKAKYSKA